MTQVYRHLAEIVTLSNAYHKDGRRLVPSDLSLISDGAIVFSDEKILWLGQTNKLPPEYRDLPSQDLKGHVLTPEIVDAHTHLIFGGDRSLEYAQRLNGVDYQEIANQGGGILFTMQETLRRSDDELYALASSRVERLYQHGVGTIEIKSGYALTIEGEERLMWLIHRLKQHYSPRIQIFATYMAAHAVPKNFSSSADYMNSIVMPLLERLAKAKIIDAVDIFHEQGYFSTQDVHTLFKRAHELNISCRMHADEFADNSGAAVAVSHKALSADHLLKISESGIKELAASPTVATILPGTAFFLGKPLAPARQMLDAGIKLAIASDYNPGSCHFDNLLMIASLATPTLQLNQCELWSAITLNAAHSLGLREQGALVVGLKPRFTLFKASHCAQITYEWGKNLVVTSER